MAEYISFTTTRADLPNLVTVASAVKTATSDPTAVVETRDGHNWRGKKATAWTAPQIAAVQNVINTTAAPTALQRFAITSRGKDKLADCALSVRTRGVTAWNAMTTQQKKDAVLAEADIWTSLRDFIETNL